MDRSKPIKPVKYGLEIRRKPQGQRPAARPLPPGRGDPKLQSLFGGDDDDDDNVEADIARQNLKKRSQRETEQQHEAAVAEDPSVFDYDGVYDEIHAARTSRAMEAVQRQARYIPNLMKTAKDREKEKEIVQERLLAKERAKEEEEHAGKERFVTRAYREKLAERQRWLAEEKRKEAEEAANDVTKRSDLTDLYRNLYRAKGAPDPTAVIPPGKGDKEMAKGKEKEQGGEREKESVEGETVRVVQGQAREQGEGDEGGEQEGNALHEKGVKEEEGAPLVGERGVGVGASVEGKGGWTGGMEERGRSEAGRYSAGLPGQRFEEGSGREETRHASDIAVPGGSEPLDGAAKKRVVTSEDKLSEARARFLARKKQKGTT